MAFPDVPLPIPVPDVPAFPLSEDAVYEATFSGLDSEDNTPDDPADEVNENDSPNKKNLKEKKKAAKQARKEEAKKAKEEMKAKVKEMIKEKIQTATDSLGEVSSNTLEVCGAYPELASVKIWITLYQATYIVPLQAQLAVLAEQMVIVNPMAPEAAATAAASHATLTLQLAEMQDALDQVKMWYNQQKANLVAKVAAITAAVSVVTGIVSMLQLGQISVVASFVSVITGIATTLTTLIALL